MSLNIGKLDENSLEKAVGLIDNTIVAALEACYTSRDFEDLRAEIIVAWDLIYCFGDLGDSQDLFGEFLWQYNKDRGYED
mgnify:CR=1 FL=1|jgi:hypothetical protein|tara:strand:+ start:2444 stop:2683 length:240 start_codon:yes stop_codon:yes gene_type:complete